MSEKKESCGSCKNWQHQDAASDALPDSGQCRAHPPTVVVRASAESAFPVTQCTDWCGEYAAGAAKKTKAEHEAAATKESHAAEHHHAKKH